MEERLTEPNAHKFLSIVIITRNAKSMLQRCLASIYENVKVPFEIVVIDNASNDSTAWMIGLDFPKVSLIRNKRNRGVAPARNQGLKISRGKYILIIDDDAYIVNNTIDKMINFMQANPTVGVCGPKLLDPKGSLLFSCKRFPSLLSFFINRLIKNPSSNSPIVLKKHLMLDWDHNKTTVIDYTIGACQLINRKALCDVGFYDDRIFYGPEDIDFCFRMWKNGWQVWYVHDAHVVHETRRITKKNPFTLISVRHFLAILRMFLKYRYIDFQHITQANDRKRDRET